MAALGTRARELGAGIDRAHRPRAVPGSKSSLWPTAIVSIAALIARAQGIARRMSILPCTLRRPGRPRAQRSDRLGPGRSAAPGDQRLSLLPSGPDEVHTSPLRGTRSSTSISPPASANAGLGWEFSPAGADCRYRAPLVPRLARPANSTGELDSHPRIQTRGDEQLLSCATKQIRPTGRAVPSSGRIRPPISEASAKSGDAPDISPGRRALRRLIGVGRCDWQVAADGGPLSGTQPKKWRRGWDSNPRWVSPYGISSAAP